MWLSAVGRSPLGLGAMLLALYVAFDLREMLPSESAGHFTLARGAPDKAFTGETILVELTISNEGRELERLLIEDSPPPNARVVRGKTTLDCTVKRGSKVTLRYELVFREPGQYDFGATAITVVSMFGLSDRTFAFFAPFGMRVYPRLLRPRLSPINAPAFKWAGGTPSFYRGGRLEFMNIREYVPGDRLSDINWRASARLGLRLVNERQVERGVDCIFVVDLFSDDVPKVGSWSARGDIIEASFQLANSFIVSGNRVGMLVLGQLLFKVKPGFGMKNLRTMVEGMIDSVEGEVWNVEKVEKYIAQFFRKQYTRRRGTLFFISAGANMRLITAVASLSQRGFACNTVIVNSLKGEGAELGETGVLEKGDIELGEKFSRAELDWVELRLAAHSNVYEWSEEHGLVEMRRPGA